MLRALVSVTPELALVFSRDRRPVFVNSAFSAHWEEAVLQVTDVIDVVHPDDRHSFLEAIGEASRHRGASVKVSAKFGRANAWRHIQGRLTNLFDDRAVSGMVLHATEVTDRGSAKTGQAQRPSLEAVELPDRAEIMKRLDRYGRAKRRVSVLVCDLDNFNLINDSLGHAAGDQVLSQIGSRLVAGSHEDDTVGRLGADEFAILCPHTGDDDLAGLLTSLDLIFHEPLVIGSNDFVVTASIGFATLLEFGGTLETLAAADAAMHLAKDRGRDRLEVFDEGLRDVAMATLRRTSELRHAASNGELVLCYQPIVELATGRMVGCEALLRWNHPWEGQLAAESFIAIAESSGLVNSLTETLLLEACKTVVDLASSTGGAKSVAVNLSPRQLADPRLVSLAEIALSRLAAEPSSLTIEITETAVLSDLDATLNTLRKLRELGVEIALDDFGTGYSSLTHLKKLPVTKLKIDRSFVGGITRDSEDLSIVASVAHLARTLGLTCVAEGVETIEQSYILEDLGCEQAQGYLWSRAVPFSDLIRLTGKRGFARPGRLSDWSVDEDTRARILGLHRAGTSLEAIAGLLNQSGSRTARGARWKTSGVARVIARSAFSRLEPDAGD